MEDKDFMNSSYWRWCASHSALSIEQKQALSKEALSTLLESVNAGEITTLDGVDTLLSKQISAHHGATDFEMNSNWMGSSQNWACPCCSRSKFQISRVGKKGQILAKSVIHHDHMSEALKAGFHSAFESARTEVEQVEGLRLVERMGNAFAAYEEVLICEDCNNADTEAKKLVASPPYFSFSIGQIRQFIESRDHQPHQIARSLVEQIWCKAKSAYNLRMNLISEVAHAAATDTHWYEPYARGTDAIPVLWYGQRFGDRTIKEWVSDEILYKALGPKKPIFAPNLSRWREESQKAGKPLPSNFLAMLRSDEAHAQAWNSVADDWHCPTCSRSKHQAVYVGEKGKIIFFLRTTGRNGDWGSVKTICNHCASTLMSLKQEIKKLTGEALQDSYGFVAPNELINVISARPHSPHLIRSDEAAALVSAIVARME